MQNIWAGFAKNPVLGPGWNAVGTGASFAGGEAGLDVSVIQPIGVEVELQQALDGNCAVLAELGIL